MSFGTHIRGLREAKREQDKAYSLRKVANRVGIKPTYLSKIERGEFPPPSEKVIIALAEDLGENADVLLAMAGKVSQDLCDVILQHPAIFAQLLRQLKKHPKHAILKIVREVRDGDW